MNTRADVNFGGGGKTFAETARGGEWQGKTLQAQAKLRGYQLVSDLDGMNSLSSASNEKPVLGLFAVGNMPVRWKGLRPAITVILPLNRSPVKSTLNVLPPRQLSRR